MITCTKFGLYMSDNDNYLALVSTGLSELVLFMKWYIPSKKLWAEKEGDRMRSVPVYMRWKVHYLFSGWSVIIC